MAKKETRTNFETFKQIIETELYPNNKDMQDYSFSHYAGGVILSNGYFVDFDKPTIKTSFCYGYGANLRSTQEQEEIAENLAETVQTSVEHFKRENLKRLLDELSKLKEAKKHECYIKAVKTYDVRLYDCRLAYIMFRDYYHYNDYNGYELTRGDIDKLIIELTKVINDFDKRLNTYLKRYGLTKVRSWSFLVD